MSNPNTLIIGATGKTGKAIVTKYVKENQGHELRLAVRDPGAAKEIFGTDPEYHNFDYGDSVTWSGLLSDIDHVYMIAPPKGEKALFQAIQWIELLKQKKVKKLIFLSGGSTGDIEGSLLNEIEKVIQQSKLNFAIIRPGWFMQNFIYWYGDFIRNEDAIFLPAADSFSAFVDVENIADVVFHLFKSKRTLPRLVKITSDEALNHYQVAEIFTDILERKIQYMPLPDAEFIHAMQNRNWPQAKAEKFVELYKIVRRGKEAKPSLTYQNMLKKRPRTFREFVEKNKEQWKVDHA